MRIDQELNMNQVVETYNNFFGIEGNYKYKAILTYDIYSLRLSLCNDDIDVQMVKSSRDTLNSFNGLLIQPDGVDDNFYILISGNYLNNLSSNSFNSNICSKTFLHEYTHLIDYADLKAKYDIPNLRRDYVYIHLEPFQFYSEIRARYRSMYLYYCLENPQNRELISKYEHLKTLYEKRLNVSNSYQRMYYLAQFWGQYLAISHKTAEGLELPEYIKKITELELLKEVSICVRDESLFKNYETISELYNLNK